MRWLFASPWLGWGRKGCFSIAQGRAKAKYSMGEASMMQTYTHNVYRVHAFAALVSFPLDPMAVEVGEEAVDVVGTGGVSVPFLGIVL